MKVTKMREMMMTLFLIALVIAFGVGIMVAFGKPVPIIGKFLGQ